MVDSLFIRCKTHRLCYIVQKHRKAKCFGFFYIFDRFYDMISDTVTVMRIVLICFKTFINLRQKFFGKSEFIRGL